MESKALSVNRKIAVTGAMSALIVVLGITRLGFITLNPTVSLTILHIPVLLAAMMAGLPGGLISGAVFGIFSLIQAAMNPAGALLNPFFVNPCVSVLPRMLLGVAAWGFWKLFRLIPRLPRAVPAAVTAFLGTLAHTCLVIGSLYILYHAKVAEIMGGLGYFAGLLLLLPNALPEAIAATIVCGSVFTVTNISAGKRSKLSEEDEAARK